jgi:DNA repair protein RadA/Sms
VWRHPIESMTSKAKPHASFLCNDCGHTSPKWEGRCGSCGEWGTYVEFVKPKAGVRRPHQEPGTALEPVDLGSLAIGAGERLSSGMTEVDRLLGGGIVPGSVALIAGEPGVGKSTLLLQVAAMLAGSGHRVLYVSGEESGAQVQSRAQRLGVASAGVQFLAETDVDALLSIFDVHRPDVLVIDSIQTLYSQTVSGTAGSVVQVRECAQRLLGWAKGIGAPVFLAGHVTKDGAIAGPRVLEHLVDVVLYLEGEGLNSYRMLRCSKNRFGATDDVALFEMMSEGLAEVADPSAVFIAERRHNVAGSAVVVAMEGSRPLLAEVQALTNPSTFNPPRRTANGIDFGRMVMIAAVLTRRARVALANQDIMVNVAGGLRINEPSADLAVALAIGSSHLDNPLDSNTVYLGEVGLGGEIRRVPYLERRLAEAAKHGFTRALIPANGGKALETNMELVRVENLALALDMAVRGDPKPFRLAKTVL